MRPTTGRPLPPIVDLGGLAGQDFHRSGIGASVALRHSVFNHHHAGGASLAGENAIKSEMPLVVGSGLIVVRPGAFVYKPIRLIRYSHILCNLVADLHSSLQSSPRLQRDRAGFVEVILGELGIAASVQGNEGARFGLRNEMEPPGGVGVGTNGGTVGA